MKILKKTKVWPLVKRKMERNFANIIFFEENFQIFKMKFLEVEE